MTVPVKRHALKSRQRQSRVSQEMNAAGDEVNIIENPKFQGNSDDATSTIETLRPSTLVINEPTTIVLTPTVVTRTVTTDLPDETTRRSQPTQTSATETDSSSSSTTEEPTPTPSTASETSEALTSTSEPATTTDAPSPSTSQLSTTEVNSVTSSTTEAETMSSTSSVEATSSETSMSESGSTTTTETSSATQSFLDSSSTLAAPTSTISATTTENVPSTTIESTQTTSTGVVDTTSLSSTTELPVFTSTIAESSASSMPADTTSLSVVGSSTMTTVVTATSSTVSSSQVKPLVTTTSAIVPAPSNAASEVLSSSSDAGPSSVAPTSFASTSAVSVAQSPSPTTSARDTTMIAQSTASTTILTVSSTITSMPTFASPSSQMKPVTTLDPVESSSLAMISSILSSVSRESVLSLSSASSASEASIRSALSASLSTFDDAPTLAPTTVDGTALVGPSITATITRSRGSTGDSSDGSNSSGDQDATAGESSSGHFFNTIGKSPGSITLVVLVCIGFVALAIIIVWLLWRCRNRRRRQRGVKLGSDHGSPFWTNDKDAEKGQFDDQGVYGGGVTRSLLDDDDEDDARVEPEDVWRRRITRITSTSEQGTDASSWTSMIGDHEFPSTDGGDIGTKRASDMSTSSIGSPVFNYGTLGLAPSARPHPLRNSFIPTFSPSLYSRDESSLGSSPQSPPAPLLSYTLPSPPRTPQMAVIPKTTVSSPRSPQSPRSPLSAGSPQTPRSPESSTSLRESLSQVMGAAAEYIGNMLHSDNEAEADRYTSFSSPRRAPPTPVIIPPSPIRGDEDLEWQGSRTSLMQADPLDDEPVSPSFLGFEQAQLARGAIGTLQPASTLANSVNLLAVPPPQDTAKDRALVAASKEPPTQELLQLNADALDPFSDAAAESLAALNATEDPFTDAARVQDEYVIRRKETPPPPFRQPLLSFLSPFTQRAISSTTSGDEASDSSTSSTVRPSTSHGLISRRGSLQSDAAVVPRRSSSGSLRGSLFSAAGALLGRRGSASTIGAGDRRGSGATITPSRLRHGSNATVKAVASTGTSSALARRLSLPDSNSSSSSGSSSEGGAEHVPSPSTRRPAFVSQASWSSSSGDHGDVDLSPTTKPQPRMLTTTLSPSLYADTGSLASHDNLLTTSPTLSDAPTIDSTRFALKSTGVPIVPRKSLSRPTNRQRTNSTSTFGTIQTKESPILSQRMASEIVDATLTPQSSMFKPGQPLTLPTPLLFGSPSPSYMSSSSNGSNESDTSRNKQRKLSLMVEQTRTSQLLLERRRKSEGMLPIKGLFGPGSDLV
ncbi:hypothetical protein OIO90_004896 [Microbotryomycetes sp. JL221]|nr:hypothetical protein OIO90_004896 [Microbotryomycetes sp. JL221]